MLKPSRIPHLVHCLIGIKYLSISSLITSFLPFLFSSFTIMVMMMMMTMISNDSNITLKLTYLHMKTERRRERERAVSSFYLKTARTHSCGPLTFVIFARLLFLYELGSQTTWILNYLIKVGFLFLSVNAHTHKTFDTGWPHDDTCNSYVHSEGFRLTKIYIKDIKTIISPLKTKLQHNSLFRWMY